MPLHLLLMDFALRYLAQYGVTAELLPDNRVRLTPLSAVSDDVVRFMGAWKPQVVHELINHDPLHDLSLLPEDRQFIDAVLVGKGHQARIAALEEYRRRWITGAAEYGLKSHERDNAGRYAANTWLRNLLH
ncbi:hypothetical protein [Marinobacterium maritimum]|uniref:hypothetical protein n=1 Tax=Marinobacterium maritimum TaxID=500162 RepID=UPI0031D80C8E